METFFDMANFFKKHRRLVFLLLFAAFFIIFYFYPLLTFAESKQKAWLWVGKDYEGADMANPQFWWDLAQSLMASLFEGILAIFSTVFYASAVIFDNMLAIGLSTDILQADFISQSWSAIRDFANVAFILGIIYVAFAIMWEFAQWQKILIRLVVIMFVLNFSLFFSRLIIDMGNITAWVFYSSITTVVDNPEQHFYVASFFYGGSVEGLRSVAAAFQRFAQPEALLNTNSIELLLEKAEAEKRKPITAGEYILLVIVLCAYLFMMAKTLFVASFMFISRIIWLMFYMIASPLAFVAYFLPHTEGYFWTWLRGISKKSFCIAVFLFFIWVAYTIMFSGFVADLGQNLNLEENPQDSIVYKIALFAFKGILVYKILDMATKVGNDWCDNNSGTMGKVLGGIATAAVPFTRVGNVLRRTVGGSIANRIKRAEEGGGKTIGTWLQKKGAEKGVRGWMARRALFSLDNITNKKYGGMSYNEMIEKQARKANLLAELADDGTEEGKKRALGLKKAYAGGGKAKDETKPFADKKKNEVYEQKSEEIKSFEERYAEKSMNEKITERYVEKQTAGIKDQKERERVEKEAREVMEVVLAMPKERRQQEAKAGNQAALFAVEALKTKDKEIDTAAKKARREVKRLESLDVISLEKLIADLRKEQKERPHDTSLRAKLDVAESVLSQKQYFDEHFDDVIKKEPNSLLSAIIPSLAAERHQVRTSNLASIAEAKQLERKEGQSEVIRKAGMVAAEQKSQIDSQAEGAKAMLRQGNIGEAMAVVEGLYKKASKDGQSVGQEQKSEMDKMTYEYRNANALASLAAQAQTAITEGNIEDALSFMDRMADKYSNPEMKGTYNRIMQNVRQKASESSPLMQKAQDYEKKLAEIDKLEAQMKALEKGQSVDGIALPASEVARQKLEVKAKLESLGDRDLLQEALAETRKQISEIQKQIKEQVLKVKSLATAEKASSAAKVEGIVKKASNVAKAKVDAEKDYQTTLAKENIEQAIKEIDAAHAFAYSADTGSAAATGTSEMNIPSSKE